MDAGFDEHCLWRVKEGGERYWQPQFSVNGTMTSFDDEDAFGPKICTDFICDFIEKNRDKPFFAYYPMMLTHVPFVTTPESREASGPKICTDFIFHPAMRWLDEAFMKVSKKAVSVVLGVPSHNFVPSFCRCSTARVLRSRCWVVHSG